MNLFRIISNSLRKRVQLLPNMMAGRWHSPHTKVMLGSIRIFNMGAWGGGGRKSSSQFGSMYEKDPSFPISQGFLGGEGRGPNYTNLT